MLFADRPPEPLADYPGYLMNWVANRSRRSFVEALAPLGLRPQQYGLLAIAASHPGVAQQRLAELAQIDPSSMVALLDELEAAGLAERRPYDEDRRKRAIHLTAHGERTLAQAREVAKQVGGDLLAPLTVAERAEFTRLLHKLTGVGER